MNLIKSVKELEDLLEISLTPKQYKVFNKKDLYILYGGAMGSGKSFLISFMALYYALAYENATCLIGRKFHISLTKTTQTIFQNLLRKLPKRWILRHNKTEGFFEFKNNSRIYFVGLVDTYESLDKIRGMELIFAGIDECQDLEDDETFKMLAGRLRQVIEGIKPRMVLTCNPTRIPWIRKNFVDEKKKDFCFIKALPKDNPYLPSDYINNQKKILSKTEFDVLILGNWERAQIEGCLFDREKINKAIKNDKWEKGLVSYGIDVSLKGTTVVAKKEGNRITLPLVMNNSEWDELLTKIKETIISNITPVYIDSIGEGAGLALVLKNEGFAVIRINQSMGAIDNEKYLNQRAENYWRLKEMLDELALPNDPELISQMLNTKKEVSKGGLLQIQSKYTLHRKGQSPDKLDAIVLSCIGGGIEPAYYTDKDGEVFEFNEKGEKENLRKYFYYITDMAENGKIGRLEVEYNPETISEYDLNRLKLQGYLRLDLKTWKERRKKFLEYMEKYSHAKNMNKEKVLDWVNNRLNFRY